MRRQKLLVAVTLTAGGGMLLGLAGQRVALQNLAAALAVGFAVLVGAAKQASP